MPLIRVVVAGATGKTGSAVTEAILAADDCQVVAAVSPRFAGQDLSQFVRGGEGLPLVASLDEALRRVSADVLVDFTTPEVVRRHALLALEHGLRPVIGTTGLVAEDLEAIEALCQAKQLAAIIVPNFSIGAVLLEQLAAQAARIFQQVEIVERHHVAKLDAPSGTALRLARRLERAGARTPVPIHSLRLPGSVAHHEVVFGNTGETLVLKHDAINRSAFAPGVLVSIRKIGGLVGVHDNLAKLLDL